MTNNHISVAFTALEKFTNQDKAWEVYVEHEKPRADARDVISLDVCLCPSVIKEYNNEDYKHLHPEMLSFGLFKDLDYVKKRTANIKHCQILAVMKEPTRDAGLAFTNHCFKFKGYDLVEDETMISALTNCGGFPLAFLPSDLTAYGLIEDYDKAREVQRRLFKCYPEEPHANCDLWAIWKMEEQVKNGKRVSLTINLEENHKIIDSVDDKNLLANFILEQASKREHCLKLLDLDLYGDTIFGRTQITELIKELLEVKAQTSAKDLYSIVDQIIKLAQKCKDGSLLYLKFYGD